METSTEMRVTKRDGQLQEVAFDKILERVKKLGQEAAIHINYSSLVMKVIDQLYDKIPAAKIDELAAEQCAALSANHPDYAVLGARIIISNHQKNTSDKFSNVMMELYNFTNFNLGIGVYIITINIWNLLQPASGSGYSNFYYSFGISNSSSTITTYLSNTYGISFGGSTVIQNTTASTIYVNIYSGGGSGVPSNFSSYNVSIVRIA